MSERTHRYPAKEAVREAWMRFLPAKYKEPKGVSGLYLAGHENNELAGYLAKGLRRDLLVSPEHDDDRFAEVAEHADGIRLVKGSVQEAVAMMQREHWPRLAFAHLDFDGSYGTYVEDMLSVFSLFPSVEGGAFGVESYSARDDDTLVQGLVNTAKFYSGLADRDGFFQSYGAMLNRHRGLRQQLGSTVPEHTHLSRELGLLWWLTLGLGLTSFSPAGVGVLDRDSLVELEGYLALITHRVTELVQHSTDFALIYEDGLAQAMAGRQSEMWPTALEQIAYYTQRRQPMRVWFLRVEPVVRVADRPNLQEVLSMVWDLAARAPLVYFDKTGGKTIFT